MAAQVGPGQNCLIVAPVISFPDAPPGVAHENVDELPGPNMEDVAITSSAYTGLGLQRLVVWNGSSIMQQSLQYLARDHHESETTMITKGT